MKAANGFGGMFARWGNSGKGVNGMTPRGIGSSQRSAQAANLRAARAVSPDGNRFALEANLKLALRELAARSEKITELASGR